MPGALHAGRAQCCPAAGQSSRPLRTLGDFVDRAAVLRRRNAPLLGPGPCGNGRYKFLQIYSEDFTYAAAHANAPAKVVQTNGPTTTVAAQSLLDLTGQKLLAISEP